MTKAFRLRADQIAPLAEGHGACIASDMITVEGHPVGFMYREAPDNEVDSGWRFLSGLEDEAYMDDAGNHAAYDVNTIANYDPGIIPLLGAPEGSAFEKAPGSDDFVRVTDWAPPSPEVLAPRRLGEDEFASTCGDGMHELTDDPTPPFDFWPYFDAIPAADFEGHECTGEVDHVWATAAGNVQHVLVNTKDADVFMAIVLDVTAGEVVGHRLMDMKRIYGVSH